MLINAIYSFIKIVSDFINEYFFNHLNTSMDEAKKEESNVELEEGQIISVEEEMKGNESVKSTPVKNINQKQDVVEEKAKSIPIKEELTNEDMVILNKEEVCEALTKEEKKEDEIDKNSIVSVLKLPVYKNSEATRPYKLVLTESEFVKAVELLKKNENNCW